MVAFPSFFIAHGAMEGKKAGRGSRGGLTTVFLLKESRPCPLTRRNKPLACAKSFFLPHCFFSHLKWQHTVPFPGPHSLMWQEKGPVLVRIQTRSCNPLSHLTAWCQELVRGGSGFSSTLLSKEKGYYQCTSQGRS